jgi:hypothetical protein
MKRVIAFCARNYVAWSAFKLGVFTGCLIGMIWMALLLIPAIAQAR